jgi:nitric oxide reductase subunit B
MPTNLAIQYKSDKPAKALLILALSYLLFGLGMGVIGGFQYILPNFLKEALAFQKTRPLHVYLVITWIFTAAQGGLYYYLPRIAKREIYWNTGAWIQVLLQIATTTAIITCFFLGIFGGREYLEFPPIIGLLILISWIPFAINFFATLKSNYAEVPVYIWSWTTGIIFFYITMSESYLWIFDYFKGNIVRDVTVQWKALGSMVGSWNMLVYGTGMFLMEKISGNTDTNKSKTAFFFFFLGFTNLLFNWGHHTYIVPASPWVKTVAFTISMTELLILGNIIHKWKKTVTEAQKHYHHIAYKFLAIAEFWIFVNLVYALVLSVPAWNYYTHGTHFTVAHAMGATIGINTMLLLASVFYILNEQYHQQITNQIKQIKVGIYISNISLLVFWVTLIGMGLVKISSRLKNEDFTEMMTKSMPYLKVFAYSGVFVMIGLLLLLIVALKQFLKRTF